MENQLTTFVCPNCGANTTNPHHCDYCGSILVRFAANNVTMDETIYGKKATTIPGLKEELKANLSLQKVLGEKYEVATRIFPKEAFGQYRTEIEIGNRNTFSKYSKTLSWGIELSNDVHFINRIVDLHESAPISLIMVFSFYHLKTGINALDELVKYGESEETARDIIRGIIKQEASEEKFLLSSYSHLAEKQLYQPVQLMDGDERDVQHAEFWSRIGYFNHYVIDFGEDNESAANVITQFINETEGLSADKVLDAYKMETEDYPCSTEEEWQAQKRAELEAKEKAKAEELERAAEEHSKEEDKKIYRVFTFIGIIFLIIVFILYFYNN